MKEHWYKAVKGDKSAEDEIFRHLHERFTLLAGLVMCREDAEDISSEACAAVFGGYKSLTEPFEYFAWAQKILRNKIANYFQRKSVEGKIFDKNVSYQYDEITAGITSNPELMRSMMTCLDRLIQGYPRYARAINLVQLGYNIEEICEKMDISRDNLYVILNRGRKILKNCIFNGGK